MTDPADPAAMRRAYLRGRLDDADPEADAEATTPGHWLDLFRLWFGDAASDPAIVEANAMQLATASADGRPAVRTVLLKGVDERGIVFYTNLDSAKGRDIAANPRAAVVFAWLAHERQVRLTGAVHPVSAAETDAYFASRPRGSQLGAWASPQSEVVSSRAELERRVAEIEQRFTGRPVPTPPRWGGLRIEPDEVEFWQGRADRLHDRLRYRRAGTDWLRERLAP